jgi:hypothetical protein
LQILDPLVLRQDPFGQGAGAFGKGCRHVTEECNSRALRLASLCSKFPVRRSKKVVRGRQKTAEGS